MKILIIENDKTFRQSLSYFIEHQTNCEVFFAGSKSEGASLFKKIPFDIVLCGDRLPDGGGLEILKEWTGKNPKLVSILMTVQSDEGMREEAKKAGVQGFLVKPFDLKQLEEAMGMKSSELRISGKSTMKGGER